MPLFRKSGKSKRNAVENPPAPAAPTTTTTVQHYAPQTTVQRVPPPANYAPQQMQQQQQVRQVPPQQAQVQYVQQQQQPMQAQQQQPMQAQQWQQQPQPRMVQQQQQPPQQQRVVQQQVQQKPPPPAMNHQPQKQQQQAAESSVTNIVVGDPSLAVPDVTRELVKKFIADIWNRGETDLIPEVCSPSIRFNGNVGMDRVGHDGFALMVTKVREAMSDYHCEIHSMVVESNKAFCRLRFTGRHTGILLGYEPTGRQVSWMGASEFTCKNGRILKVWELGDVKTLEDQLKGE